MEPENERVEEEVKSLFLNERKAARKHYIEGYGLLTEAEIHAIALSIVNRRIEEVRREEASLPNGWKCVMTVPREYVSDFSSWRKRQSAV